MCGRIPAKRALPHRARRPVPRPKGDPAEPYERVVIWLGREWLERSSDPGEALDTCFDTTRERGFHLLRFDAERRLHYMQRIQQLEEALRDRSFGAARMADTLCQQMLIDVNRDVLRSRTAQEERDSYRVDPKMEEVLRYILDHLGEELTVESLSKRFFISRYYLMHRFKAVTGYTVHQYISQKRLLRAKVEFQTAHTYDYFVINDTVENAVGELNAIITAEHCKPQERMEIISGR